MSLRFNMTKRLLKCSVLWISARINNRKKYKQTKLVIISTADLQLMRDFTLYKLPVLVSADLLKTILSLSFHFSFDLDILEFAWQR